MLNKMKKIIGVSGASGSGKSTFAEELCRLLPECYYLSADKHYKKELPVFVSPLDGNEYPDWNQPDSLDRAALMAELEEAAGEYDIVVVDGAFIFCLPELLEKLDYKIYIDATIEMRIFRRIRRNLQKGQTIDFIGGYYLNAARFREKEYSLPSRELADITVDNENGFHGMVETIRDRILSL